MSIPEKTDVVVIGGGPGGSCASTYLRQKGYEVVLFDSKKHPRYNVGESLAPAIWRYCDLANVSDKIATEGFVAKAGGTTCWNGAIRQLTFGEFGFTRPGLHVERDRFDEILLTNAKAHEVQVFEEVTVLGADLGTEPVVTYRSLPDQRVGKIACRFVVDASGQGAVLAKQLGVRVIDKEFRFMSVWGYFTGSKFVGVDGRAHPSQDLNAVRTMTFITGSGERGWVWHIPLRESTSVGFVLPLDEMKRVKSGDDDLTAFFVDRCRQTPYLSRLLEAATYVDGTLHVIRDYSYRPSVAAGPGWFLIGDAAGFVDPIFSIGVTLAMHSAYVAAWAVDRSFKEPARTAEHQATFSTQVKGHLELTRGLALPNYGIGDHGSDFVKWFMQFKSGKEKELMYAASTVTSRNIDFRELIEHPDGQKVVSTKYRELSEIVF